MAMPGAERVLMTEPEAWRYIAEKMQRGAITTGMCYEIHWLNCDGRISGVVHNKMTNRVDDYLEQSGCYAYEDEDGFNVREDEGRCLAALWLALEAEEEANTQQRGKT